MYYTGGIAPYNQQENTMDDKYKRKYTRISWGNLDRTNKERQGEYDGRQFVEGDEHRPNQHLRQGLPHREEVDYTLKRDVRQFRFEQGLFKRMKELQEYVRKNTMDRLTMECTLSLHHASMEQLQGIWGVESEHKLADDYATWWPIGTLDESVTWESYPDWDE